MGIKKRAVCAAVLCAVGMGIAGLQCGLESRYYVIRTDKIARGKGLRLLMLSDLHSCPFGENQSRLLFHVRMEQPDLILLCGDIVDDQRPQDHAKALLSQLTAIAPCYYVAGNHEFWSEDPAAIFRMIEGYGICVLRNMWKTITVQGIELTVCGVDDPAGNGTGEVHHYGDPAKYQENLHRFDEVPVDCFTVLLAHRPEYMREYAKHPFDLTLCGHAHGGQWRIPYLMNGLIAPNQGWFPQYAGGQYHCGKMTEIVGRGLMLDWKPRLFNPPEIVVVDVKGTKDG